MPKKLETPEFRSEDDEAAWWAANPDTILQEFRSAAADGTLRVGSPAKSVDLTPTTTIRLARADIEMAKEQAAVRGLRYQTYLKSIIHQALLAAKQESSRLPSHAAQSSQS